MTYRPNSDLVWIVIHYSATPIERDFTAADIDQMHRLRGFNEIGYHYFIRKDGTVEKGRDMDQPGRFEQGAHSQGENDASIGICYEGGVSASAPNIGYDTRTRAQKVVMEALILTLLDRFPKAIVEGHRDMPGAATQCPGFDARAWWSDVAARRVAELTAPKEMPANVAALAEDAGKPMRLSKTFWATLTTIFMSLWQAWQAADPIVQAIALASAALVFVVMFERFRKSRLGKAVIAEIGL
jgi:N-acetylmuramoyl-L-alanine amidase